jgi:UDP:flavonoid glycosyltransferase YjiC (YdhE family)
MVEIMTKGSGGSLRPTDLSGEDQVRAAARGFSMIVERTLEGITALVGTWRPDVVIAESTSFGAPLAADRHGVPFVEHRPGLAMPTVLRKLVAEELGSELPEPALVVDNCPRSFQHDEVTPGHVTRYVPYNGPGVMADWMLARGEHTRVCVTLGTGLPHAPGSWSLLELIIATLDRLPVEMVLAVPDPDEVRSPQWKELPASVRAVGRYPLSVIVPTCDLVINHGGVGSTMTTLVNGLPQLSVPHYGDQFTTARKVSQRGVGLTVPVSEVSPETITDSVTRLLDEPRYREAARAIAEENAREPSPADLVEVVRTRIGG